MNYRSTKLRQALASEYVAGTLTGAARERFKRLMAEDPSLREEVKYWELRFGDLGIFEPVPPRELVWTEIEQRIRQTPGVVIPIEAARQKRRLMFWRLWAGLATAASVVLAVILVRQQPPSAPLLPTKPPIDVRFVQAQAYVAALKLPKEDAQWTVSVLPDSCALRVIASQPAKLAEDEDYELWWLGEDGGATSLGLLPRDGAWQVLLPSHLRVKANGRVAVSLEPAGGSQAEDGPSGPVLLATPLVPSV
ncbi:MAG: anti-sigma factor [Panacagrimonas sp.]